MADNLYTACRIVNPLCNLANPNGIFVKIIWSSGKLGIIDPEKEFDLVDYMANPCNYKATFEKYIPKISMLINCVYWDKRYPRLITKEYLKKNFHKIKDKLLVVGDISCDVEGAVECTLKATEIQDPVYVYDPVTENISMGFDGEGLQIMAVDILPSELPRDSSQGFGDVLVNFVKPVAVTDFSVSFEELELPKAIKKGLILHNGELTQDYKYIYQFL